MTNATMRAAAAGLSRSGWDAGGLTSVYGSLTGSGWAQGPVLALAPMA